MIHHTDHTSAEGGRWQTFRQGKVMAIREENTDESVMRSSLFIVLRIKMR
jgi:hypothetical protein